MTHGTGPRPIQICAKFLCFCFNYCQFHIHVVKARSRGRRQISTPLRAAATRTFVRWAMLAPTWRGERYKRRLYLLLAHPLQPFLRSVRLLPQAQCALRLGKRECTSRARQNASTSRAPIERLNEIPRTEEVTNAHASEDTLLSSGGFIISNAILLVPKNIEAGHSLTKSMTRIQK